MAVLLRLQMERLRDPEQSGVLLVLGSMDWQRQMVIKELVRMEPTLQPAAQEDTGPSTSSTIEVRQRSRISSLFRLE